MKSGSTSHSSKSGDLILYFLCSDRHKIGKLVDDDKYQRKRLLSLRLKEVIVTAQVSYLRLRKTLISSFHLDNSPLQGIRCLLGIRYDRH